MAELDDHPSPKHDTPESDQRSKTTSSAAASPPSKRPPTQAPEIDLNHAPSNHSEPENEQQEQDEDEEEDEEDKEVGLIDMVVLNDLFDYHKKNGVYPFEDPDHMQRFCAPWIRLGFGNAGGWKAKIEELKNRFDHRSHESEIDPREMAVFYKWKMVFGNEGN